MAKRGFHVKIEPSILVWARESIGYKQNEVAIKLKLDESYFNKIEKGIVPISYENLEKLAKIYQRPIAAFMLKEPPEELPLPKDYRTIKSNEIRPLLPKTYFSIRKSRRIALSAIELHKELNLEIKDFNISASLENDPEKIASEIRKIIESHITYNFSNADEVLSYYISKLFQLGIFTFQLSGIQNDIRGISITNEEIPVIVIKRIDEQRGKLFTLFHELGHIILSEGGICDLIESDLTKQIEIWCNRFSGSLLVPFDELLHNPVVQENIAINNVKWTDNSLYQIAQFFHVSKEVILRRLLIAGYTTHEFYKTKHDEWLSKEYQLFGRGKRNDAKRSIQERGKEFVKMILMAHDQNKIGVLETADYLNVKLNEINKVREYIYQ